MADKPDATPKPTPTREERLAAALRDNLKRRKTQARGRATASTPDCGIADTAE